MNRLLWVLQTLLALLFLLAGGTKLFMSVAELTGQTPIPAWFLRFIGVMEILGGLGLILPGMLRIHTALTFLAAAGLSIIMIGAVVVTIQTMSVAMSLTAVCNRHAHIVCGLRTFATCAAWCAARNGTQEGLAFLNRKFLKVVTLSGAGNRPSLVRLQ